MTTDHASLTIRRARPEDRQALERLAALDSAQPLAGPALVAESHGRLLAALPLDGRTAIADPFEHTTAIVALLRVRAAQLRAAGDAPVWWNRTAATALA